MIDLATTDRASLRVDEVMELFDVSRRTVYNWISDKKIPTIIKNGTTQIDVEGLRRLIQDRPRLPRPFSFDRATSAQRYA